MRRATVEKLTVVSAGPTASDAGEAQPDAVVDRSQLQPINQGSHFASNGWASALNKTSSNTLVPVQKEFGAWGFAFGNGAAAVKFTGHTLSKVMPYVGTREGVRRFPGEPYWQTALDSQQTAEAPDGKCTFSRSQLLSKAECASLLQTAVQSSKNPPKAKCIHPDEREELGGVLLGDNQVLLISLFARLDSQVPPVTVSNIKRKDLAGWGGFDGWTGDQVSALWAGVKAVQAHRKSRLADFKAAQKAEGQDVTVDAHETEDMANDGDAEMEETA
jgi:hypothetical protein